MSQWSTYPRCDGGSPSGGGSTAANQVLEIAALNAINAKITTNYAELTGLSATGANSDLLPSLAWVAYRSFSLQITGTWSGSLTFQGSNDNVNFIAITVSQANFPSKNTSNTTTNGIFVGSVNYKYLRVRFTSFVSGTANGTMEAFAYPNAIPSIYATLANSLGTAFTSVTDSLGNVQLATRDYGYLSINPPIYNDYTMTPVTSAAWVQIDAAIDGTAQEIEIFDSSGQFLYLGTGNPASEVIQMIIYPGGNGRVKLMLPETTPISLKAVGTSATSGAISINMYG